MLSCSIEYADVWLIQPRSLIEKVLRKLSGQLLLFLSTKVLTEEAVSSLALFSVINTRRRTEPLTQENLRW